MSEPSECTTLQSREEWLAARQTGLGSSDAPVILGLSPWKSPLELYAEKLQIVEADQTENEAMEWGHLLEPVVAQKYQAVTGRVVRLLSGPHPILYRRVDLPFLLATPDALTTAEQKPGEGPLEIKTTRRDIANLSEEIPLLFNVQIQHQLAVTGLQWASLAILVGGQRFLWCDVERNERFIALLVEKESAFWDRIIHHDPPAPDSSERTRDVLAKLYPKDTGVTIALPPDAAEWDARRIYAKGRLVEYKKELTEAENLLKAAIGEATEGILPDGTAYTWKASKREGYTVEPTTVRTLRKRGAKE